MSGKAKSTAEVGGAVLGSGFGSLSSKTLRTNTVRNSRTWSSNPAP